MADALLDLFQIDELDVAANRAGRLSPGQHDRMADRVRKMTIISSGACVLFVLAALARGADGERLLIAPVTVLGVPTRFIPQGKTDRILAQLGLDADGLVAAARAAAGR